MLQKLKEKLAAKKEHNKAIAESRRWKEDALLQDCLQAMRGSCTLAPMELHEAAIAVVNIAMQENIWTGPMELIDIPEDFFPGMVYIAWNDAHLPVLRAPWSLVEENLPSVRAVAHRTFLVAQTMDRILSFDDRGQIRLYSIA